MDTFTKLDAQYPKITAGENNAFYVSILQNLYSGCTSELTAILQYVYQTHYFEAHSEQTAKIILSISIVEMEHLELLAGAIKAYGGDPKYVSSRGMFYSTKSVDYTKDYISMLLADLTAEKGAIKSYNDAISMVKDPELIALLTRILMDEELHYKTFENLLLEAKGLML